MENGKDGKFGRNLLTLVHKYQINDFKTMNGAYLKPCQITNSIWPNKSPSFAEMILNNKKPYFKCLETYLDGTLRDGKILFDQFILTVV